MGLAAGLEMGKPHALPTEAWEGQPEAARLRAEQIRVLFQQQPVVVATNVAVAVLVALVLTADGGSLLPLLWLLAMLIVAAVRFLLWRRSWRAHWKPAVP